MSNSSMQTSPARSSLSTMSNRKFLPLSIQELKGDTLRELKTDMMAKLDKEVKAMDEDDWMFEEPRSDVHFTPRRVLKTDAKGELKKKTKALDSDDGIFGRIMPRHDLMPRPVLKAMDENNGMSKMQMSRTNLISRAGGRFRN